jgi:hypothetical protein
MATTGREDYEKFSIQVTVIGKKERKKEIINIGRNNTNREVNVSFL